MKYVLITNHRNYVDEIRGTKGYDTYRTFGTLEKAQEAKGKAVTYDYANDEELSHEIIEAEALYCSCQSLQRYLKENGIEDEITSEIARQLEVAVEENI